MVTPKFIFLRLSTFSFSVIALLKKNGKEKDILIESQTLRKLNSSDNFEDVLEIKDYSKQS